MLSNRARIIDYQSALAQILYYDSVREAFNRLHFRKSVDIAARRKYALELIIPEPIKLVSTPNWPGKTGPPGQAK
jgi:hypothetical protein